MLVKLWDECQALQGRAKNTCYATMMVANSYWNLSRLVTIGDAVISIVIAVLYTTIVIIVIIIVIRKRFDYHARALLLLLVVFLLLLLLVLLLVLLIMLILYLDNTFEHFLISI